jgi:chromosome segregation protein
LIFRSLKMAGFKSFAEVAEVEIESGMTGIVGPNGCGKSNVVEGLRWVMGESNARQMRGGEMDDLIFSGTDQRPARNLAEITLNLDNSRRVAPAEFNNDDDIEITRKIERGKGSSYFVNAKPARAKDVQLLFADSATGARSSGMVSQGRIGAIVGAKPNDRRALLEEAANITGLHSRRHEAELRLRGAETNLERLDDVIAGLTEQRDSLRKQARQDQPLPFGRRTVFARPRLSFCWQNGQPARQVLANPRLICTASGSALPKKPRQRRKARQAGPKSPPPCRRCVRPKLPKRPNISACQLAGTSLTARKSESGMPWKGCKHNRSRSAVTWRARPICAMTRQPPTAGLARRSSNCKNRLMKRHHSVKAANLELEVARESARLADAALAEASAKLRAAATTRAALANRIADLSNRKNAAESALAALDIDKMAEQAKTAQEALVTAETTHEGRRAALETAEYSLADAQAGTESAINAQRDAEAQLTRLQAEIDALQFLLADTGNPDEVPVADLLSVRDGMEDALRRLSCRRVELPNRRRRSQLLAQPWLQTGSQPTRWQSAAGGFH